MTDEPVCPQLRPPTGSAFRFMAAKSMLRLSMGGGRTIESAARDLNVDEKTVRRVRNEDTSINAVTLIGMFWLDPMLREELLAPLGERPVKVRGEIDQAEVLPRSSGLTHQMALAQAANSDGGQNITDAELLASKAVIAAAHEMTSALLARIAALEAKKGARE